MTDTGQPKHLTAADFEPWGLWASVPDCPWCGKRNCVAPAMSQYGTVLNVCHRCHSQWEALQVTPEQRAALLVLKQELEDSIDGGDECRGHDTRITRQLELCDMALGNYVDGWARLAHWPAIRDQLRALDSIKEQMGKV